MFQKRSPMPYERAGPAPADAQLPQATARTSASCADVLEGLTAERCTYWKQRSALQMSQNSYSVDIGGLSTWLSSQCI